MAVIALRRDVEFPQDRPDYKERVAYFIHGWAAFPPLIERKMKEMIETRFDVPELALGDWNGIHSWDGTNSWNGINAFCACIDPAMYENYNERVGENHKLTDLEIKEFMARPFNSYIIVKVGWHGLLETDKEAINELGFIFEQALYDAGFLEKKKTQLAEILLQ